MSNVASCVAGSLATVAFASEFELHTIKANPGPSSTREEKPAQGAGKSFKEHRAADAGIQAQAEKVLRAFNTWSFKREQPSDPQLMLRFITDAIATQAAIPFVLYWGKGPRHETGAYEIQCLPRDLVLGGFSLFFSLMIAIPLGIAQAVKRNRRSTTRAPGVSFLLYSMPQYAVAMLLIQFLSITFHVFPGRGAAGRLLAQDA